jgi:hypothetical protein
MKKILPLRHKGTKGKIFFINKPLCLGALVANGKQEKS